ncbi:MAG: electron transfer flavoprotein alpha subunit [Clostridia bacterium]|nr:electron transfer flavoprotein alpha subunit [Clostridia bacterium]
MNTIWIISDVASTAYELSSKVREELGDNNGTIIAYILGDEQIAKEAFAYGTDIVKLLELSQTAPWEQYVDQLVKEAEAENPQMILVGASRRGKDLAAKLAAHLDCPCVSECSSIDVKEDKCIFKRIVYGGLAEKLLECKNYPVVATVASRTFSKNEKPGHNSKEEIYTISLSGDTRVKVLERRPKSKETVDISEAKVVVGVGRGFAEKEDLKLAEELAKLLGGEVACTRPVAEDYRWLPEDRYIGISGQVVKPEYYIAIGISGQVQHVYGIRDSKTIIAIDKNENAPIHQVADYYIVGDLKEILPAMIEAIKKQQAS